MPKEANNLKRLIQLDNAMGYFHNSAVDLDSIEFADDVPQDFIDLWKKKMKIDEEFNERIAELKSL